MAHRWEKEENGEYALVIDGWENGIAPDPYSGINRLSQANLDVPGEISVGYPITTSTTSGGTLGNPIADSTRYFSYGSPVAAAPDAPQSFAILDATGFVWESTSITGTWARLSSSSSESSAGPTDGLAYWLGYLFKTRGTNIDYWNGSTWTNGWSTALTASTKHFMYVGTDNVLYITNGNYLAAITATDVDTFDPSSGATYTVDAQKLRLPTNESSLSLAEVGTGNSGRSTLLVGGTQNAIYPWDKISTSFGLPIYVGDAYQKLMISVNQNVFIFPGNQQGRGRIYITNGGQADLFFKVPDYIFDEIDPYYVWGDAIFHKNNLLFGFFVTKNSGSGTILSSEVWGLDLATKAFRSVSNIPANATAKGNATCLISTSSLSSPGFGYIIGWNDSGSAPGIGYSGTTAGIGSGTWNTDLLNVGTFIHKKTFSQVEFKLRSPLQSGESISIFAISDRTNTTTLSFTPTPTTGSISGVAYVNSQVNQWLQFQVAATGNSASSGVQLKEIRLR